MKGMARGVAVAAAVVLLAGCEGTLQQKLGLVRPVPDEFQTVRHKPLEIPKDFTLPPPGTRTAAVERPETEVRELLLGEGGGPSGLGPGEEALLRAVKVKPDPRIRTTLAAEERARREGGVRSLFVLPWQKKQRAQPAEGEVLDPVKEAERLSQDPRVERVVAPPPEMLRPEPSKEESP
ncbi:hypothetical protein HRbin39_00767 [bacterium HR39]|nr:hypothetical protein HRbin39_00767 [bacterium HR39]